MGLVTTPVDPSTDAEWLAAFRLQFAEFSAAPDAFLVSKLSTAYLRTPVDVWGPDHTIGVLYLAAHLAAMAPEAEAMRLTGGTETLYKRERDRMARAVASGFRVAGIPDSW